MSSDNFFAGILDPMRGTVNDTSGFFNSAMGDVISRTIAGGAQAQNSPQKLGEANSLSKMDSVADQHSTFYPGYAPTRNVDRTNEAKSENFENVEMSWLQRLHRFAQIDASLQAGKVNEGKPQ